jgi:ubiquinone/menaquinone biosynthesis C-methylase UbiE
MTQKEHPTTRKRELMNLYDTTASIYDRRYRSIQYRKYEYVIGSLSRGDSVLDVGCGIGLLFRRIGYNVASLVGVDMSVKMLKMASMNSTRRIPRVSLVRADADSLPFRDNTFTRVASVTVLQNMPDPSATVKEIARVTSIGGQVALTSLKKKHSLLHLRSIIASSATGLNITSEWDNSEEDVGVNITKLI